MNFWKLRLVVTIDQLLALVVAGAVSFIVFPTPLGTELDLETSSTYSVNFPAILGLLWLTQLFMFWNPSEFTSNRNLFRPASIGRSSITALLVVGLLAWMSDSLAFLAFGLLFVALGSVLLLIAYGARRQRLRSSHRPLWIPENTALFLGRSDTSDLDGVVPDTATLIYVDQRSDTDEAPAMAGALGNGTVPTAVSELPDALKKAKVRAAFYSRSADWNPKTMTSLISQNQILGIDSLLFTNLGPEAADKLRILLLHDETVIHVQPGGAQAVQRVTKRLLDVAGAGLLLALLLPLMVAIAIAIRMESEGPALFRSERLGLHGGPFTILKFRTMRNGAHAEHNPRRQNNPEYHNGVLFKDFHDDRVTRFGRFLRKSSIDELPQLWNVIVGDMSLVGPRPHLADEMEGLPPEQLRRLTVRPGMTGLWQVNGRSLLSWEEAVKLDLLYISCQSLWLDVTILARTVPAVLSARGAF